MLVVPEGLAEALGHAVVERLLADVTERGMAEIVAEPDRLDEVLVEAQGTRDRARDLRDLQRVGQAGAVVIALREHEHLRLVHEAPERLAVDDAVAVALKRRAQAAVGLGRPPARRIGTGRAAARTPPPRGPSSRRDTRRRPAPTGVDRR